MMKIFYTPHFKKNFRTFSPSIQKKFKKQISYFITNIRHPSLHAKKYDEKNNIWQARVDRNVRFYFTIRGDSYILLEIKVHPK